MNSQGSLREIPERLGNLTFLKPLEVLDTDRTKVRGGPDLRLRCGTLIFLIKYKPRSNAESVGSALACMDSWGELENRIPILAVPYMGAVGSKMCAVAGRNWMDLSGNASIRAPGVHVNVSGHQNRFARPGRPPNVFAPKGARLARAFLMYPERRWSNRDLADETGLSKGHVSKTLKRLQRGGFIGKSREGTYWLEKPESMLDAWRDSRGFSRQTILRGHVAGRTPEAVLRRVIDGLDGLSVRTAITGLAAAWYYQEHAAFRICAFYVSPMPTSDQLSLLGFRPVDSGSNVWLVLPDDDGVFSGGVTGFGLPYVTPVQVYLDLKEQPERSQEAADELRSLALRGRI